MPRLLDILRFCLVAPAATSALPARAAPVRTHSDVAGLVLAPLARLPHAPGSGKLDEVCDHYRITPKSEGGQQAAAQTAAPFPTPTLAPGLYETETRGATSGKRGVRRTDCIASGDADAFLRETRARYLALPQFRHACRLSATKRTPDGYAFAMECIGAKTIVTYRFAKNLFGSTTETQFPGRPDRSSAILTLSRRIGACPGAGSQRGQ